MCIFVCLDKIIIYGLISEMCMFMGEGIFFIDFFFY